MQLLSLVSVYNIRGVNELTEKWVSLQMKSYEDAPQAQGHPNKGSSFVLLRGLEADGYEPYQKSHSNFTMESHDRDIINLLRTWMVTHPFDTGPQC